MRITTPNDIARYQAGEYRINVMFYLEKIVFLLGTTCKLVFTLVQRPKPGSKMSQYSVNVGKNPLGCARSVFDIGY